MGFQIEKKVKYLDVIMINMNYTVCYSKITMLRCRMKIKKMC